MNDKNLTIDQLKTYADVWLIKKETLDCSQQVKTLVIHCKIYRYTTDELLEQLKVATKII